MPLLTGGSPSGHMARRFNSNFSPGHFNIRQPLPLPKVGYFATVSMKAQIVLVDDDPGDVILVKEALYSWGLRVDLRVIDTEGQADEFFSTLGANEHPCPFWFCST